MERKTKKAVMKEEGEENGGMNRNGGQRKWMEKQR